MGKDHEDRYEKEIKDLLNGMPDFLSDDDRQPIPFRPRSGRPPQRRETPRSLRFSWPLSSAQTLVVMAFACLFASFVVRYFSPAIASYLGIASGLLFIATLVVAVFGHRAPQYEKRWRGQPIDYGSTTPDWQRSLQQFWWRTRARFRRRRR